MKYLLWCANAHINFRIPELKAIASFYKIHIKWIERKVEAPYVIVELNKEEDALKISSQSLLIRACYELWAQGSSDEELHSSIKNNLSNFNQHISKEEDFRLTISSFNKRLTKEQKYKKVLSFSYIPFKGNVNLSQPKMVFTLIEYYGIDPNRVPDNPYKRFFGRWLTDGDRDILNSYTLKKRNFIGTTSMDAELAFVMANMAQVGRSKIVVDPFVGTGSILVSAAQRGAYVWGWDIDYLTLHAKTKPSRFNEKVRKPNESILSNLKQYGLESRYLDVLVMDSSRCMWKNTGIIDAIITDPPYGIRESTERVGYQKELKKNFGSDDEEKSLSETFLYHYPPKINYDIADIMMDLLNFAARYLRVDGRLVFWLPVFREDYTDQMIPSHPCLLLEFNSEQILSTHSSRRLITMVKTREPEDRETTHVNELGKSEEFRLKCSQASQMLQSLTKDQRKALKKTLPMDKRGQGFINNLSGTDAINGIATLNLKSVKKKSAELGEENSPENLLREDR